VRELGGRLVEGLAPLNGVEQVRGRGLMLGIGLAGGGDAAEIQSALLADGLIVNVTDPRTLRLLPPLVIGEADVDQALALLSRRLG
jgi:acetylornithine/succinyldiaminopimelate/putrescine aminotransferase